MSLENENNTGAAENQAPKKETFLDKAKHSLGKTAVKAATVATLAGAVATQESCQKERIVQGAPEYVTPTFNTQFFAGRMGVFYNTTADAVNQGGTQQQMIDSLKKYQYVAVQPALISAQEATANGINAFAYGSGISLVPPGTTSGARYNQLYADILAVDGFLKNAAGQPLFDPTIGNAPPAPFMVDLRKPAVYAKMREYLIEIGKAYPKGLFFDSQDAATFVENNDPTRYAGITKRMLDLMKDVGHEVTEYNPDGTVKAGRGVVVGGGLIKSTAPGLRDTTVNGVLQVREPIFDAMASVNCVVFEESQYALNGNVRSQSDHDWSKGRFVEYGKAIQRAVAADPLKPNVMGIFALEDFRDRPNLPATFEQRKAWAQNIADFYRDISNAVKVATIGPKTPNGVPLSVSIYTADFGFNKKIDIDDNLRLKGLISKLDKMKKVLVYDKDDVKVYAAHRNTVQADEFLYMKNHHDAKQKANDEALTAMLDDVKNQKPEDRAFAAVRDGEKPKKRSFKDELKYMGKVDETTRDIIKSS